MKNFKNYFWLAFAVVCLASLRASAANTPPVLLVVTNRVINGGETLSITNSAIDTDVPAQQLTFSLLTAPAGPTIDPNTGIISWLTTTNNSSTSNFFQVVVTDNGTPAMSATNGFAVFVRSLKPNVLIIVTDDQGYHDISAHGAEMPTPNMDRLGSEGIRLERFYATPVCSVTRSTLLTGRNPIRTGVNNAHGLDLHEHIMPQTFKAAGYQTFMCGKWHLGGLYNTASNTIINGVSTPVIRENTDYQPQNRGWDIHYGQYTGAINYYTHISQDNGQWDWWLNGQTNLDAGWSSDLLADKAVSLLQQRDPSKPVLLYLAFNAVHGPVSAATNFISKYTSITDTTRRTLCAAIDQEDTALGRVLAELDSEGITTNTLVVYFSDNGGDNAVGSLNIPLRGTKGDLYDGGIHTVAAVRWPGVLPSGVTNNQQFVWCGDWFPTICAATGVTPLNTKPFDGVNMWPLLLGATNGAFNPANYRGVPLVSGSSGGSGVFDVFNNGTGLTMFKLIRDKLSGNTFTNALFDIIADPYETTDLINVSTYSSVVTTLSTFYGNITAEAYPPYIGVQPQSQTVAAGSNVTFWAMTTVYLKQFSIQWRKNGTNILTATNYTAVDTSVYLTRLDLTNVSASDAATYDVVVTDKAVNWPTSTNSLPAVLTVTNAGAIADTNIYTAYDVLLGRPTANSIAVSVLASNDMQAYLECGTQSGVYTNQTATNFVAANVPTAFTISQLQSNQKFFYRLRFSTNGVAPFSSGTERTFATQRARGSIFTFDIEADPHYNDNPGTVPSIWQQTLTNVLADQPDFLIDLGDTFMGEKYYTLTNPYTMTEPGIIEACAAVRNQFFNISGHSVPLFLVDGNHDPELGWWLDNTSPHTNPPVWAAGARELYYPCPIPGGFYSGATNTDAYQQGPRDGYYAFEWGDALFVVLDPFWYSNQGVSKSKDPWAWTLGTNQYFWLKSTLETSTAKFKFIFAHHLIGGSFDSTARGGLEFSPYFEWGGLNTNGTPGFASHRPGWPMPIRDLLLTNHAQVFFHGHDHLYVKQDYFVSGNTNGNPDFIYQEVPQPSHYPYDSVNSATDPNYNYTNGVLYGSSGHLRVTVSPTNASVDYVRSYRPADESAGKTNRVVTYTYSIPAPTNPPPVLAGTVLNNSRVQFSIAGTPGQTCTVQASTNLINWTNVFSTNLSVSPFLWNDAETTNFQRRFYRVLGSP